MCHPYDYEVWKNFNLTYPSFDFESRNVRLCWNFMMREIKNRSEKTTCNSHFYFLSLRMPINRLTIDKSKLK